MFPPIDAGWSQQAWKVSEDLRRSYGSDAFDHAKRLLSTAVEQDDRARRTLLTDVMLILIKDDQVRGWRRQRGSGGPG